MKGGDPGEYSGEDVWGDWPRGGVVGSLFWAGRVTWERKLLELEGTLSGEEC